MPTTEDILAERGTTHGDFTDYAHVTQALKTEMHRGKNWGGLSAAQTEALEMIQHKVGRILSGNPNHQDHWDDIAGYAKLVSQRLGGPKNQAELERVVRAGNVNQPDKPQDVLLMKHMEQAMAGATEPKLVTNTPRQLVTPRPVVASRDPS